MQIYWHGYTSVRIESKNGEQECTLVTDPFENETSVRFPRTIQSDVAVLSHQDRSLFNMEALQGKPFIISDPGEYEVKGVFVNGIQDGSAEQGADRPVIFRFMSEGISVGFFGNISRKPTDAEYEQLENVDILMLSVGGGDGLDVSKAVDIVGELEPRIVIPLNFDIPGIKKKLGSLDAFTKQLGANECEHMPKFKIQRKDLPVDTLLVAVLERA